MNEGRSEDGEGMIMMFLKEKQESGSESKKQKLELIAKELNWQIASFLVDLYNI